MVRVSSSLATSNLGTGGAAQVKPCQTCARQITLRAKFKANFEFVKYCATSCREQNPGRSIKWIDSNSSLQGTLGRLTTTLPPQAGEEGEKRTRREVDLERWVDMSLLDVAKEVHGKAPLPACEDVEAHLEAEVKSLGVDADESAPQHPLFKALHSPPGLRERVRRAARRQIIFPSKDLSGRLLLYNKGRTTPLATLEDVSYAKGPISLKWEASNT